jgi:integrase
MKGKPTPLATIRATGSEGGEDIQKRVGFHTFRHTYTTLLTQNN